MTAGRYVLIALLAAVLAGCGSVASKPMPAPPDIASKPGEPATGKRGGYYLDDGPGENPPADIDAIPDAVPRPEALLPRANRPYVALGNSYTPMTEIQPYQARGVASWYGRRYHGNKTSSGEVYDMYGMTAAHPTLPIPSYVRVTNPDNGRSVVVRVNDRGPFHAERLIDLSYAAAYKLRLVEKGSGLVEVEAIAPRAAPALATAAAEPTVPAPPLAAAEPVPPRDGLFVQLGAFQLRENAEELQAKALSRGPGLNAPVESWYNNGIYRVRAGPYGNRADAENDAAALRRALGISTYVTIQQETP